MKSVETKKNEVREITSDISRMKGKYHLTKAAIKG